MPTDDPNGMTYRITQVKLAIWATTQNFHVAANWNKLPLKVGSGGGRTVLPAGDDESDCARTALIAVSAIPNE